MYLLMFNWIIMPQRCQWHMFSLEKHGNIGWVWGWWEIGNWRVGRWRKPKLDLNIFLINFQCLINMHKLLNSWCNTQRGTVHAVAQLVDHMLGTNQECCWQCTSQQKISDCMMSGAWWGSRVWLGVAWHRDEGLSSTFIVVSLVAIPFRLEAHWYGEVSGAEDAQECW